MQYKPWPIIILAILHLLEPFFKIFFYSFFFSVPPMEVVYTEWFSSAMTASHALYLMSFFLLFPIAGFSIYMTKKWSLYVFFVVELFVLGMNLPFFMSLIHHGRWLLLFWYAGFALLNVLVVFYFLVPAVKIAYLDPRIRWWESCPRYKKTISCKWGDESEGEVLNISQTGIFLSVEEDMDIGRVIMLEFEYSNVKVQVEGTIIHQFRIEGKPGYGVRFSRKNGSVNRLIRKLGSEGVERRPKKRGIKEFTIWLKYLLRTGEGFLPKKEDN